MEDLSPSDLRTLYEATPTAVVLVDPEGRIRSANPAACELFGWEPGELHGRELEVLVPEALREEHRDHLRTFLEDPEARPMGAGLELEGRRKDGSVFPVEIALRPLETDRGPRVMAAVHDLTERSRVRSWGIDAVEAAEDERRRVAQELHDDTAQRLATLQLRVALARRAEDEDRRREILKELHGELRETTESVRRLIRALRPPVLDELGLGAAVRSHLQSRLGETSLSWELRWDGVDEGLDEETELAVYRIVQEAVANVVRHAGASSVTVRMEARDGGTAELVVADDGRGFEVGTAMSSDGSYGLLGIRERVGAVGGRLRLESARGEGTTVRVVLPLDGNAVRAARPDGRPA